MGASVTIIGAGDVGARFAAGLAEDGAVDRVVLADLDGRGGPDLAGMLASSHDATLRFHAIDGTRQGDVERLLKAEPPDLLVQAASLIGPWALMDRRDPAALAIASTGLGIHLPAQLPVLMSVMRAVREVDFQGPVANISLPDITNPILLRLGLAPTVGLGNVSMQLCRVRAALRVRAEARGGDVNDLPLIRVFGHHRQVYGVVRGVPPEDPAMKVRVHLGEEGVRDDDLAYEGHPIEPSIRLNQLTCAAALPVLKALLPGAAPRRYSTPAPHGLPGGYPVRIHGGEVELDMPPGVDREEVLAYFARVARGDGIERIDEDGTVHFTKAAQAAVADIDPGLAEPLNPDAALARFERLKTALGV